MAVTATLTARDVAYDALWRIGVTGKGFTPDAADTNDAISELNSMLKEWQLDCDFRGKRSIISVPLTDATASYAISPRPVSVEGVRYKDTTEIPMYEMSAGEYDALPDKASTGQPTQYFLDLGNTSATLYVWPVKAVAGSATLEITAQREVEDLEPGDTLDCPSEHYGTVKLCLAARMADFYARSGPHIDRIVSRAELSYLKLRGAERPDAYTFGIER